MAARCWRPATRSSITRNDAAPPPAAAARKKGTPHDRFHRHRIPAGRRHLAGHPDPHRSRHHHHHFQPAGQEELHHPRHVRDPGRRLRRRRAGPGRARGRAAGRCGHLQRGQRHRRLPGAKALGAGFARVPLPARHRHLPQARGRGRLRPGRGHRHHHAVPLRSGLCGRQRRVLHALREPRTVPRGGFQPAGAAHVRIPPRGRSPAAGRALHGRGRAGSGPGQPCGAAHRMQHGRPNPGPQARRQAAQLADRDQAPHEGRRPGRRARAHRPRGR